MRKVALFGALGVLSAIPTACTPDVPQSNNSAVVQARFDPSLTPPVVPTPTDLVFNPTTRRLDIPIDPSASAAEREFLGYLNSLDGYPGDTPARATFNGTLDPGSVTPSSVRVMDFTLGATPAPGVARVYSAVTVAGSDVASQVAILPPPTGWITGHIYAMALIGGSNGLKGSGGEPVVGSSVWALARLNTSLVTCTDLSSPDCRATTEVIPSDKTDPAERIRDQTATAIRLEMLRLHYKPILDELQRQGIDRSSVALVWTFNVSVHPIVTFDPSKSVIPFPNDALLSKPDGGTPQVMLPPPDGGSAEQRQLVAGLNTLDGFSTTAPIISENADALGALNQGKIDPATLVSGTGFLPLGGNPAHPRTLPKVTTCLDCASSLLPDGGTPTPANPQQLQFVPTVPLDEKSSYGVYISTNVKDCPGTGTTCDASRSQTVIPSTAFALARLSAPLVDSGKSTVDVLNDEQATSLERLRKGLQPFIDGLAAPPLQLPREKIALAWAFTTQSEVSTLRQLHGFPNSLPPSTANPFFIADRTIQLRPPPPIPSANIGKIFVGEFTASVLLTGLGGTLNPGAPSFSRIPFLLTIPATPAPSSGYPVTVFGHGLTGNRANALLLADSLAGGGHATIAADVIFHGDRAFCVGSKSVLPPPLSASDDFACIDANNPNPNAPGKCDSVLTSPTYGRCIAPPSGVRAACDSGSVGTTPPDLYCSDLRQGQCLADLRCEGGDFRRDASGASIISGWNVINLTNLFASRDNLRQQVVDLSQLARVIGAAGSQSLNGQLALQSAGPLNGLDINYAGQSLGGILGTLYASVANEAHRVVLNVPGASLGRILLTSPSFIPQRTAFLAALAQQGITSGTPGFDSFIGITQWILDPADSANMAFSLRNGPGLPTDRAAFVQYITRDQTVPNASTVELINAANRPAAPNALDVFQFDPSDGTLDPRFRHTFLLNFTDLATTRKAQCQVANYVNTGIVPSDVTCP